MLQRGRGARFVPCAALGTMELLRRSGIGLQGKTAVVVGDSNIVGLPLSMLLREHGVGAVTVCHRIALQELFRDAACAARAGERAGADSCVPRLPTGPAASTSPGALAGAGAPPPLSAAPCAGGGGGAGAAAGPGHPLPADLHLDLPTITSTADILVVADPRRLGQAGWSNPTKP